MGPDELIAGLLALDLALAAVRPHEVGFVDIDPAVPEISTPVSLTVILVVLVVVTVASLVTTKGDPSAKAHPGSLKASRREREEA